MKKFLMNPVSAYVLGVIIIACAGIYLVINSKKTPSYNFTSATQGSITQSVEDSGTVAAAQNVPLEFQSGGEITEIDAKVGDMVTKGQTIAKLDTKSANASISAASAAVESAKANYQKVIDGASGPQIDVAKAALENAQVALNNAQKNQGVITAQQTTAVSNAQSAMFNAGLVATPSASNANVSSVSDPTISGTYTGTIQGSYSITLYASGNGLSYQYTGLENGSGVVISGIPLALGKMGLFITFPSASNLQSTNAWTVSVPNTESPAYLPAYNAYQTALQTQNQALTAAQEAIDTAQAAYDQSQAQLASVVTPARSEDVTAAQAAVNAADAEYEAAENTYDNSVITAPFDGQIGTLTLKVGTTVNPNQAIGTIITSNKYEVDIELSQAQISKVKTGDTASITFDAYPGQQFAATLASIDTAATMDQNASVYDATLEFVENDSRIKAGLGANVTISDITHDNAVIVPAAAIITKDNEKFVLVKGSNDKTSQVQVTTGIENSDNVEILSGLSAGQQVVTF
jgi:HlyD family secretion protein